MWVLMGSFWFEVDLISAFVSFVAGAVIRETFLVLSFYCKKFIHSQERKQKQQHYIQCATDRQ